MSRAREGFDFMPSLCRYRYYSVYVCVWHISMWVSAHMHAGVHIVEARSQPWMSSLIAPILFFDQCTTWSAYLHFLRAGAPDSATEPSFYIGGLSLGPHACVTDSLTAKPSSQLHAIVLMCF